MQVGIRHYDLGSAIREGAQSLISKVAVLIIRDTRSNNSDPIAFRPILRSGTAATSHQLRFVFFAK